MELAIEGMEHEIVEILLMAGAWGDGYRLLTYLIKDSERDLFWFELLLKYGININDQHENGDSILHFMIDYMCDYGFSLFLFENVNRENLLAFDHDNRDWQIVLFLLESGMDVNLINKKNQSCLSMAVESKFVDMTKILISYGADVNFRYQNGTSLLDYAVSESLNEIVQILIEGGGALSLKNGVGNKPIETALRNDINVFKLISFMDHVCF